MRQPIASITGPSGAGKTETLRKLVQAGGAIYQVCITSTTREPRMRRKSDQMEENGVDYYFRTRAEFEEMIRTGEVLEHDIFPPGQNGNYYGCERRSIESARQAGKIPVVSLTAPGIVSLAKAYPGQTISIFIEPESIDFLRENIMAGRQEPPPDLEKRLETARMEIELAHGGAYDHIVINRKGRHDETVRQVHTHICEFIETLASLV